MQILLEDILGKLKLTDENASDIEKAFAKYLKSEKFQTNMRNVLGEDCSIEYKIANKITDQVEEFLKTCQFSPTQSSKASSRYVIKYCRNCIYLLTPHCPKHKKFVELWDVDDSKQTCNEYHIAEEK